MSRDNRPLTTNAETPHVSADDVEPSGDAGPEPDRDPHTGRFAPGNRVALVTGEHSAAFWQDAADRGRELRASLLRDGGHTEDDAPEALRAAVDGVVQAVLIRDSAFLRVVESGGPMTLRGRKRAVFTAWLAASDRAHRYLQLVGLERKTRPVHPLDAVRAAVEAANTDRGKQEKEVST